MMSGSKCKMKVNMLMQKSLKSSVMKKSK